MALRWQGAVDLDSCNVPRRGFSCSAPRLARSAGTLPSPNLHLHLHLHLHHWNPAVQDPPSGTGRRSGLVVVDTLSRPVVGPARAVDTLTTSTTGARATRRPQAKATGMEAVGVGVEGDGAVVVEEAERTTGARQR